MPTCEILKNGNTNVSRKAYYSSHKEKTLLLGATVEQSSNHDISQHDAGRENHIERCDDTIKDGTHCDKAVREKQIERSDDTVKDGMLLRYNVNHSVK